jgi:hypothetical protein
MAYMLQLHAYFFFFFFFLDGLILIAGAFKQRDSQVGCK